MTNPVQVLRSTTPGNAPSAAQLAANGFALNLADALLFWLDATGAVRSTPLAKLVQSDAAALIGTPTAPTAPAGNSSGQIATTAFVAAAITAILNQIEGNAPGALDTLGKLAAAFGNDPNFAATTASALANRLRVDQAQGLTLAQRHQARVNLAVDERTGRGDADYQALATDRFIALSSISAARTLTLPAANSVSAGKRIRISDETGALTTSLALTIAAAGSDTINGAASTVLTTPRADVELVSDGSSKWSYDVKGVARGGTGRTDGGNLVPSGAVAHFAMTAPPIGWLKANGAAVSRTAYAALLAAIGTTFGAGDGSTTFNVPDLRGQFLRSWADNGSVDSGRVIGSAQAANVAGHQHRTAMGYDNTAHYAWLNGSNTPIFGSDVVNPVSSATIAGLSTSTNVSIRVAYTDSTPVNQSGDTRPANVALLACIKF